MKKLLAVTSLVFIILAIIPSCKKDNGPFVGTWRKVITAGDTANFKATDNSNFQYSSSTGAGISDQGSGDYSYTGSQLTFTFRADASGNNCIGTPGVYSYVINGNTLNLTVATDVCTNSSSVPRYFAVNGNWLRQ